LRTKFKPKRLAEESDLLLVLIIFGSSSREEDRESGCFFRFWDPKGPYFV